MLKNILNLNGIKQLSRKQQSSIFGGGGIDKCCVRTPGGSGSGSTANDGSWCNSNDACFSEDHISRCSCRYKNAMPSSSLEISA